MAVCFASVLMKSLAHSPQAPCVDATQGMNAKGIGDLLMAARYNFEVKIVHENLNKFSTCQSVVTGNGSAALINHSDVIAGVSIASRERQKIDKYQEAIKNANVRMAFTPCVVSKGATEAAEVSRSH